MAERKELVVDLSPDAVIELLEARLHGQRGWTVERSEAGLLMYPRFFQLIPKLDRFESFPYPEPLAVRVTIEPEPKGGARVEARLVRHRARQLANQILRESLHPIATGSGGALTHIIRRLLWRERRKRGKLEMLRLAVDPLMPHERGEDIAPFR